MSENNTQLAETTKKDIRSFLASDVFKNQVALSLPKHLSKDRFSRVALTALTKTPKLADCTRESLLLSLMTCSQLGIEPDGIHAFLIPYKTECTLIIGYRGLIALARRSGDVAVFRAELVKEEDQFEWNNGTVTHKIDWRRNRGKTDCVYSYVRFKDGSEDWEVMTMDEALAIRDRSQGYKAAIQYNKSHPWLSDEGEMLKKTVLRRHSKRLTLSPEFMDALDKDGDRFDEIRPMRDVTPRAKPANVPVLPPPSAPTTDLPLDDDRLTAAQVIRQKMEASGLSWRDVCNWSDRNGEPLPETPEKTDDTSLRTILENWDSISL